MLRWCFRSHALCVRDNGTLPPATSPMQTIVPCFSVAGGDTDS
jgi:hypothetical protein